MKRVEKKVVVVTGGALGIGRETCLLLAKEGAKVVIADIDAEKAEKLCKEIKKFNRNCFSIQVDVSNSAEIDYLVKTTIDNFNAIDILINILKITKLIY